MSTTYLRARRWCCSPGPTGGSDTRATSWRRPRSGGAIYRSRNVSTTTKQLPDDAPPPWRGAEPFPLPIHGSKQTFGVLAVLPSNPRRILLPEQRHLLETFAGQLALA